MEITTPFFRPVCLLLLWIFQPFAVTAQYQDLLHKKYAEKVAGLNSLYAYLVDLNDSAAIAAKTKEIDDFARKHKDRELELEMYAFMAYHNAHFKHHNPPESIAGLNEIIALSGKENIRHIKIRAIRTLAHYYWQVLGNYEEAFEQYLLLDKELGFVTAEEYPDMAKDLLKIGESYYFFRDYTQAKKYLEKIIGIPETEFNTHAINSAKNTLALCYQKEGDLEQSDLYLNKISESIFPESRAVWERIMKGNLGNNLYFRKEFDKAIPLLESDYIGAELENDFGSAAGALIILGDIFLEKGNASLSWKYLAKAREYIARSGQHERLRRLYPVMSKWYGAKDQIVLSRAYLDSAIAATNSYHENFNAAKALRAQQKINRQEEQLRLAEFSLEKQRKASERIFLVTLVTGLCLFIILGYYVHRKRQLSKDLQLQTARKELDRFTQNISDKNKLIEQLQSHHSEEERNGLIYQLQQSTILTDEDWMRFQHVFEKVHRGFIGRLKEKAPSLTPAETRVLVLTKLGLSTREMAGILGVGTDTIRQHRSRLRKKLDLTDESGLDDLLADL